MNGVISLCHFCELHGPSVLFNCQSFHDTVEKSEIGSKCFSKRFYGVVNFDLVDPLKKNSCEACQSFNLAHLGYVSNDHENHVSYVSTREVLHSEVVSLVQHACIRSLSCEVSPGKEGPVFFGDEIRGHVLSYTFFLKDSQARGFNRWFSITVIMKDKLFLLNSWPYLVKNLKLIISKLQSKATKVYESEQSKYPQRALRLASLENMCKQAMNKSSRSLIDLTGDDNLFLELHCLFTWILKTGADRGIEKLPEGLPQKDLGLFWEQQQETEEGFMLVTTSMQSLSPMHELEANPPCEVEPVSLTVTSIRQLQRMLGSEQFLMLAYGVMVGLQVIIRGQPKELVTSIIKCFKVLVPRLCYRAVLYSEEYLDASQCNLLGLNLWVAAPQPNPSILRLDILSPCAKADSVKLEKYSYKLTWSGKLPIKCPTVLMKMEKAIDNPKINDRVLLYHFNVLKKEWLNIAKVIYQIRQTQQDVSSIMQSMGAQDHDRTLLDFWATGAMKSIVADLVSSF